MKKTNKIIFWLAILIPIIVLVLYWPTIVKEHQLNKIKKQIEKVELKIEANKQERLNCETNMVLWNKENESNRGIVNELKINYNNMVGFTEAWQPE